MAYLLPSVYEPELSETTDTKGFVGRSLCSGVMLNCINHAAIDLIFALMRRLSPHS